MSIELNSRGLLVRASAGSGKTHFLTSEIIKLLLLNEDPKNILTTTFTRKSAGEIFGRVLFRLLTKYLEDKNNDLDSNTEKALSNLLKNQDYFKINTIDSFIASIAKAFFLDLGLPETWSIGNNWKLEEINKIALGKSCELLGADLASSIITLALGNLLPARPSRNVLSKISNLSNLYIESTEDAWENNDLLDKYCARASINIPTKEELLANIDSILKREGLKKRIVTAFENIKELFSNNLELEILEMGIISNIDEGKLEYYSIPLDNETIELCQKLSNYSKNLHIKKILNQTKSTKLLLTTYLEERNLLIFEQGILSFSDVTNIVSRISEDINLIDIYARLDSRIHHILIDEFQDTAASQWSVLNPLVESIVSSTDMDRSFLAVGDLKQAIYGWRGGASEIFDFVKEKYSIEKEETLDKSYRSNPEIINFVNMIFLSLAEDKNLDASLKSWLNNFQKHTAAKDTPSCDIKVQELKDEDIKLFTLCNDIKNIIQKNTGKKIAVLVSKNDELKKVLNIFEQEGIEATGAGKSNLGEAFFAKIIISLLRLAANIEVKLSITHLSSLPEFLKESINLNLNNINDKIISKEANLLLEKEGLFEVINKIALALSKVLSNTEKEKILKIVSVVLEFERTLPQDNLELIKLLEDSIFEQHESTQVTVSTIHGSKGLEYEYVFIPYTNNKFYNLSNLNFLIDQENNFYKIKRVIKKPTDKIIKYFPELVELRDRWIISQIQEGLSVSYVALTRAVKGLYIYLDPLPKNQSEKISSLSDIIRYSLKNEADEEGVLLKKLVESPSQQKLQKEAQETNKVKSKLFHIDKNTDEELIPSFTKFKIGHVKTPTKSIMNVNNLGISFGLNIHQALSKIKWLEVDSKHIIDNSCSFINDLNIREKIKGYLTNVFSSKEICELFYLPTYSKYDYSEVEVFNELKFTNRTENSILTGIIDRIVIQKEQDDIYVHIIDFKTDNIIDPSKYKDQLLEYKNFAIKKWPTAKVKTSLIYLGNQQIIDID